MDAKAYKEIFTKDELDFILNNSIRIDKIEKWAERKLMIDRDMTFDMSEKYSYYLNNLYDRSAIDDKSIKKN